MQVQRLLQAGRRKGDRHEVHLPAVACRGDGTKIGVRLLNISYDGCQLATDAPLEVGESIKLSLGRLGETTAEVRWPQKKKLVHASPCKGHYSLRSAVIESPAAINTEQLGLISTQIGR